MKMVRGLVFSILILGMTALHAQISTADGLPVPWPFPWADKCSIEWQALDGVYKLADSATDDQIILRVAVVQRKGLRMVRVSRYTGKGTMIYDGSTYVTTKQKAIGLYLDPTNDAGPSVWVRIRMAHTTKVKDCTQKLVPIMTVQVLDPDYPDKPRQYQMVKLGDIK